MRVPLRPGPTCIAGWETHHCWETSVSMTALAGGFIRAGFMQTYSTVGRLYEVMHRISRRVPTVGDHDASSRRELYVAVHHTWAERIRAATR